MGGRCDSAAALPAPAEFVALVVPTSHRQDTSLAGLNSSATLHGRLQKLPHLPARPVAGRSGQARTARDAGDEARCEGTTSILSFCGGLVDDFGCDARTSAVDAGRAVRGRRLRFGGTWGARGCGLACPLALFAPLIYLYIYLSIYLSIYLIRWRVCPRLDIVGGRVS